MLQKKKYKTQTKNKIEKNCWQVKKCLIFLSHHAPRAQLFFMRPNYRRRRPHIQTHTHPNEHTLTLSPYEHLWRTELDQQISRLTKSP